ncbi:histamine N-methyltransferase-like isoform X2 [Branchiostoma floridae x Branchiostoma belcheri]
MAGLLKIGQLKLSPERYFACFRAWRAAIEVSMDNYYRFFGPNVPDTVLCEPGAALRVLGIGSGSGEMDSVMLKKLLQRHNSVYSRVVEPSEEMIGRYKSLVREDASLGAVKFDWRQQTAEEYFTTKEDTKFHLIHAIQVLYHVEDLHATLRNMWEQLADGGCMFIAMLSVTSNSGLTQWPSVTSHRRMKSTSTSPSVSRKTQRQDRCFLTSSLKRLTCPMYQKSNQWFWTIFDVIAL